MDDLSLQADEIEALSSIYGDEWHIENDSDRSFSIKLIEGHYQVTVYITLSLDYPTLVPPSVQLLAPSLSRMQKQRIALELDDIYLENIGQSVIYQLVEKIRDQLQSISKGDKEEDEKPKESVKVKKEPLVDCSNIYVQHGPIIQDRKSIFQGHVAEVHSVLEIKKFTNQLMENKKIAEATHNISAYRILLDNSSLLQDYDDDGENHAGRRLLHLLQILDVTNVIVIVTRWYGGTQLGPDRFRHINNAGRQALQQAGFIEQKKKD